MLLDRYKEGGFDNLEPQFRGRKKTSINKGFEQIVFVKYLDFPMGSHKMWLELKTLGFSVSQRQIQHIYNKNNFKMNLRKRPSQIKFVKHKKIIDFLCTKIFNFSRMNGQNLMHYGTQIGQNVHLQECN